jgi:hypothetical protein
MTVITDTYLTYDAKGLRESLSDNIYRISPEETPFQSMIGKGSSEAVYDEWQTDALAAADDTNAVVEGDEAAFVAATPTVRLGNYHQISRKTALISGTLERVSKAGRKSEMALQLAKKSAELKRDMEKILTGPQAAVAGGTAVARKTAGFEAFLRTNVTRSSGGTPGADPTLSGTTAGYPNAAPTDGSVPRVFTDTLLKEVSALCYASGGKPSVLMVGTFNRGKVSTFAGIASNQWQVGTGAKPVTVVASVGIWVGDFHTLQVVPNLFSRDRTALLIQPDQVSVSFLRPFFTKDIAATGDAEKKLLLVEYELKVNTEAAHGAVADLTTA